MSHGGWVQTAAGGRIRHADRTTVWSLLGGKRGREKEKREGGRTSSEKMANRKREEGWAELAS